MSESLTLNAKPASIKKHPIHRILVAIKDLRARQFPAIGKAAQLAEQEGIEVMLNAAGLAFVVAGARWHQADGQVVFLFILAMAAAEVAVGLALVMQIYRRFKSLDVDALTEMRG